MCGQARPLKLHYLGGNASIDIRYFIHSHIHPLCACVSVCLSLLPCFREEEVERNEDEGRGTKGKRARGELCSLHRAACLCYTAICYARREAQQEFMAWRHGQGARSHPSSGPSSWRFRVFAHSPGKHLMQTHPSLCLPTCSLLWPLTIVGPT